MELQCLTTKKVNGQEVVSFIPIPSMRLFALSLFCDPATKNMDPEDVCEHAGLPKNSYKKFLKFEPYFGEWLEEFRLAMGGRSRKQLLESVGMERALAGEFNFWKPLAIREGVISEDKLLLGASLPANLGNFTGMSDEQLAATENSIMDSLRGKAESGAIDLFEGPDGWKPEGNPPGAAEVREERVVLVDKLGADGELGVDLDESF